MKTPKQITKEEADKLIAENMKIKGDRRPVVIIFNHKWYDIRGFSKPEMVAFINKLTGQNIKEKDIVNINL